MSGAEGMSRRADARAHLDLQINLLTEKEITLVLQMLNEMGFSDSSLAFNLLQQHLGIPASLSSADSHVSPEGMQNVISALLAEQDSN